MNQRPFPGILVIVILVIAVVNMFAHTFYWYWIMRWFDMPMHFAGGAWLAGVAIWFRFFSGKLQGQARGLHHILLWGIGVALCVGLVWEGYETIVSLSTVGHINSIPDTISDLVFDFLGALFVGVGVWIRFRNTII